MTTSAESIRDFLRQLVQYYPYPIPLNVQIALRDCIRERPRHHSARAA